MRIDFIVPFYGDQICICAVTAFTYRKVTLITSTLAPDRSATGKVGVDCVKKADMRLAKDTHLLCKPMIYVGRFRDPMSHGSQ